jgi:hypothetical protein
VGHAGFDVDEITSLVFQYPLEPGTEFVPHLSFDDIKDEFEAT